MFSQFKIIAKNHTLHLLGIIANMLVFGLWGLRGLWGDGDFIIPIEHLLQTLAWITACIIGMFKWLKILTLLGALFFIPLYGLFCIIKAFRYMFARTITVQQRLLGCCMYLLACLGGLANLLTFILMARH